MTDPHLPMASAPSPEDDPTGVRALLSGLPEPDPMPEHLVTRINASLAAAQAERAASRTGGSVAPLVANTRRRPRRVLFAVAGAAAAVALIAVVGDNLVRTLTPAGSSTSAGSLALSSQEASGAEPPAALDKAAPGRASTPPPIQIRQSETRYTQAGFATQARTLGSAVFGPSQLKAADSAGVERLDTAAGLTDCLRALGAGGAQLVRADLAFYEGAPAVIIVATTDGIPVAYAVGPNCSSADAAVLHPATALP